MSPATIISIITSILTEMPQLISEIEAIIAAIKNKQVKVDPVVPPT